MDTSLIKLWEIIDLNYWKWLDRQDRLLNNWNPVYWANWILAYSHKFLYEGESIIVGRKGSAGVLTRVSWRFRPLDVTYYITPKGDIDMDYLFYVLKTLDLPSLAQGVKPWINRNDIYTLPIPLPPLEEQKKIVAYLDELNATISKLKSEYQSQLAMLDEMRNSSLDLAFWGSREREHTT